MFNDSSLMANLADGLESEGEGLRKSITAWKIQESGRAEPKVQTKSSIDCPRWSPVSVQREDELFIEMPL